MNWLKLPKITRTRAAQFAVVGVCAAGAKLFYSTASVNQLRWILAPTTFLVEFVTGSRFEFESYAGYLSSDRRFVIAASCAGVNFLITAFLILSLRKLWSYESQNASPASGWKFVPLAAAIAYLATIVANTVRISTALQMRGASLEIKGLSPDQLHRVEGILIYFGFLLLLFFVSEKLTGDATPDSRNPSSLLRRALFPLLIYYAITLGVPLAGGASRQADFWEHSLFVLLIPLVFIVPLAVVRLCRNRLTLRAH